jgi:hypothetical protein
MTRLSQKRFFRIDEAPHDEVRLLKARWQVYADQLNNLLDRAERIVQSEDWKQFNKVAFAKTSSAQIWKEATDELEANVESTRAMLEEMIAQVDEAQF